MCETETKLRNALRELVALFHASHSNYISGSNPYCLAALRNANQALTGDAYECGFNVTEACEAVRNVNGIKLVLD